MYKRIKAKWEIDEEKIDTRRKRDDGEEEKKLVGEIKSKSSIIPARHVKKRLT